MSQIPIHTVIGTDANGNAVYREVVAAVNLDGSPISSGGGSSGSGGGVSDTIFKDSTGQIFIYRDTGSGTPVALSIPSWSTYTPVGAVSATSSSLSNYSLETGGNLEAINTAFGTDGETPPTITGTGVRGWLRGAFEKLEAIRAAIVGGVAVTGTFWQTTQPVSGTVAVAGVATATGQASIVAAIGTPLQAGGAVTVGNLPVTQAVSAIALPLPAGAATATGVASVVTALGTPLQEGGHVAVTSSALPTGAATDAKLTSILSAIQATVNLTGSVWFDSTVTPHTYYVRRESVNEGTGVITVSWETPAGVAATPTVTNLVAVSNAQNISTDTLTYSATSSGTGYASGDLLVHTFGVDTSLSAPILAYSFWLNAGPSVSGSILSASPTSGTYAQTTQAVSVAGGSTSALQTTGNASLASILAALASVPVTGPATAAQIASGGYALDGTDSTGVSQLVGGVGIRGWLSGCFSKLTAILAAVGSPLQAGGAVSVSNLPATQTVSGTVGISGTVSTGLAQPLTDDALRASLVLVEPLGAPAVARQMAATVTSTNIALTVGIKRISMAARISPIRYVIGSTSQSANSATSHYLSSGERIDIKITSSTTNIAVIRASDATVDGAVEISELS